MVAKQYSAWGELRTTIVPGLSIFGGYMQNDLGLLCKRLFVGLLSVL